METKHNKGNEDTSSSEISCLDRLQELVQAQIKAICKLESDINGLLQSVNAIGALELYSFISSCVKNPRFPQIKDFIKMMEAVFTIKELAHEKLYEWYWKDVPLAWRTVFHTFSHLYAMLLLVTPRTFDPPTPCLSQKSSSVESHSTVQSKISIAKDCLEQISKRQKGEIVDQILHLSCDEHRLRQALHIMDKGIMMGKPLRTSNTNQKVWDLFSLASVTHAALVAISPQASCTVLSPSSELG